MGKVVIKAKPAVRTINGKKKKVLLLDNKKFDKFNSQVLNLGDIRLPSKQIEAFAAMFDLSGFTNFCNQVDPHLSVPKYLSSFMDWLFEEIKTQLTARNYAKSKALWSELPFLAKFLGDGALFLWNTGNMHEAQICNIVVALLDICRDYESKFYRKIKKSVVNPPNALRCGIARGSVCSVGNEQDYVGPCINIAARLQKFSYLTFCFPCRGFDIKENMHEGFRVEFVKKRVDIRGIGENELIWVLKEEFDGLPKEERKLFRKP